MDNDMPCYFLGFWWGTCNTNGCCLMLAATVPCWRVSAWVFHVCRPASRGMSSCRRSSWLRSQHFTQSFPNAGPIMARKINITLKFDVLQGIQTVCLLRPAGGVGMALCLAKRLGIDMHAVWITPPSAQLFTFSVCKVTSHTGQTVRWPRVQASDYMAIPSLFHSFLYIFLY